MLAVESEAELRALEGVQKIEPRGSCHWGSSRTLLSRDTADRNKISMAVADEVVRGRGMRIDAGVLVGDNAMSDI